MSTYEHTICDGCDKAMSTSDWGHMRGTIGFPGSKEGVRDFHSPACLILFAEKMNAELHNIGTSLLIEKGVPDES